VMRADVACAAIDAVDRSGRPLIYLSPRGLPLTQARVRELASGPGAVLLCGRFEGLDQRVIEARAIEEVKADMERPRPMDRLVCGDVGYGKTELAIRAAFKVSRSKPIPVTVIPSNELPSRRKADGSASMTATSCPRLLRLLARVEPTRPQPMITKCTQS